MKANISRFLNQRFDCPKCHVSGNWGATARAMVREASTIQGFRCRSCAEEIVVKVPRSTSSSADDGQLAQKEYRVLYELQRTFPQDDQLGTLEPLGYLELDGYGVMITKKFEGVDLFRYASKLTGDRVGGLFRPAGRLLRKLHDSCPSGYKPQLLGVDGKVEYLAQTYGAELRSDPATRVICDQFEKAGARIATLPLRATWSHGDFKPENVLCDGHKYIVLDTELGVCGAFVYDLASFLAHLLLASYNSKRSGLWHRYAQAEEEFLDGYGGVNQPELAALRWAQLYFMLCYWGRYRQRGPFSRIYANWRIRPLIQKLAAQL